MSAADDIAAERVRQNEPWGEQDHMDGTGGEAFNVLAARRRDSCNVAFAAGTVTWSHIFEEEVFEALAESDPLKLRTELVQVAAVAMQWVEAIDRREQKLARLKARLDEVEE